MKALTVSQPFASLIASGEKWVENRCWGTQYRGPLAIHAGKGQYLERDELELYPTGSIMATCELVACIPLRSLKSLRPTCPIQRGRFTAGQVLNHPHTEGPWCWILANVHVLDPPIPHRGAPGLWEWNGC